MPVIDMGDAVDPLAHRYRRAEARQVCVSLSPDTIKRIDALAGDEGITRAGWVRRAILAAERAVSQGTDKATADARDAEDRRNLAYVARRKAEGL